MSVVSERAGSATHGSHLGLSTLEQKFRLTPAKVLDVARVMRRCPMIGQESILGQQPRARFEDKDDARVVHDFSPVPGFRFDVTLTPKDETNFVVLFSQPDREVPYLSGEVLWRLSEDGDAVIFDEQVNTAEARAVVAQPLSGPRPSLRRWLFFKVGHAKVMDGALANIARLVSAVSPPG